MPHSWKVTLPLLRNTHAFRLRENKISRKVYFSFFSSSFAATRLHRWCFCSCSVIKHRINNQVNVTDLRLNRCVHIYSQWDSFRTRCEEWRWRNEERSVGMNEKNQGRLGRINKSTKTAFNLSHARSASADISRIQTNSGKLLIAIIRAARARVYAARWWV